MLTNHELILEYIKEFGYIIPAKKIGTIYQDQMFPAELSKRCRELRKREVLESDSWPADHKYEVFFMKGRKHLVPGMVKQETQERLFPLRTIFN